MTEQPSLSRSEAVTSRYSCTGSPENHTRISRNGTFIESCSDQRSSGTFTNASTTPRRHSLFEPGHDNEDDTTDKTAVYFNLQDFMVSPDSKCSSKAPRSDTLSAITIHV